ncbi:Dyp-type peroxidase [Streptomyces sp. 6N223]|uniref:Dyp-type peroxidase n=1 Tax=Streptomyces sp. 6N223 TaxID=3457412 RepID=UPI003FD187AC
MSTAPETTAASLPLRESTEIQGDILAGFKKDHVRLLLIRFGDPWHARLWLRQLRERIATTRDVAAFNATFREERLRLGGSDPGTDTMAAVWRSVGFTHAGLVALVGGSPIADVPRGTTQEAFVQGPAERGEMLGDTEDDAPEHWLFGADHTDPVHAVLTVASDRAEDLRTALERERREISCHGMTIVFEQAGATLPGDRSGTEHFGFKDAISQPGVEDFDEPDPERPGEVLGKPGTRLIPPGEFVVGYATDHRLPAWLPRWMNDGSFQVIRRLAQDVTGWWGQAAEQLKVLKGQGAAPEDATEDWVASRMVGRWRSGAPVAEYPDAEPQVPPGPEENNDFGYADDLNGRITPLFCHLRKTNPRDGLTLVNGDVIPEEGAIDGRRIMRRGVPFGPPLDQPHPDTAGGEHITRGLLFVSYQSDLVAQFEFVQRSWVNNDNFPQREPRVGRDGVIGKDSTVSFPAQRQGPTACVPLGLKQFVRTQGALYAFTPSLTALGQLADGLIPVGGGPLEDRALTAPTTILRDEVVSSGRARLRYESDGDLVVRDEGEREMWRAGVAGRGAVHAEFRETGELVLPDAVGEIVWSTPTDGNPGATLVVGVDGDVSIRAADGRSLWHTGTAH